MQELDGKSSKAPSVTLPPLPALAVLSLCLLFLFPGVLWDLFCSYSVTFPLCSRLELRDCSQMFWSHAGTGFGTFPEHPTALRHILEESVPPLPDPPGGKELMENLPAQQP